MYDRDPDYYHHHRSYSHHRSPGVEFCGPGFDVDVGP
jgi:hypothetical protein